MASSRKSRPLEPAAPLPADAAQLTNTLRMQLKAYSQYAAAINSTLKDVNEMHTELDVDMKPINLVKGRLDRSYDQIGDQTTEELKRLDAAIETLDMLMKLPAPPAPAAAPAAVATAPAVSTPTGTGNKRGPYKKRQKTGGDASTAGSPANSAAPSPMHSRANSPHLAAGTSTPSGAAGAAARANTKAVQPAPSPASNGASTPKGVKGSTAKSKKEAIAAQLPLQVGRQVAFRLPQKAADGKKDEWILANVKSSMDKNRYLVEDADYDPSNPTPEEGKYNATIKNIIPLPDRRLPNSYPDHDFAAGLGVLALYPDTTSFYRATLVSGPHPLGGSGPAKKKDKDKIYKLKFEDDDDRVCDVLVESIVEQP